MAEAAVIEALAAALADPGGPVPPGLAVPSGADPARRLAVHRNNVFSGLIRVLRDSFPVTERVVGAAFFAAMARAFVDRVRPATPLLSGYGDGFPAFVAGYGPASGLPYLADLAAVEAARVQALHAADAPALTAGALARHLGAGHGDPLAIRVSWHPAARLVASPHPVASIWLAHLGDTAPAFDGPWRAETALLARPGDAVHLCALPPAAGCFAAALLAGASLGEAGAAALRLEAGFDAGSALFGFVGAGAIGDVVGGA